MLNFAVLSTETFFKFQGKKQKIKVCATKVGNQEIVESRVYKQARQCSQFHWNYTPVQQFWGQTEIPTSNCSEWYSRTHDALPANLMVTNRHGLKKQQTFLLISSPTKRYCCYRSLHFNFTFKLPLITKKNISFLRNQSLI